MNLEILDLIGKRLLVGEKKYGNENITNDGRDFVNEALEESLDLAVYISAKLIEIKQKEKKMGRAIDQDNRLDDHERRIKLLEDALTEMIQTRVHHVDLTEDLDDERNIVTEGINIEPDEEYTAPVGKRKKTRTKAKKVESLL